VASTGKIPEVYRARLQTTKGIIVIEVHRKWSHRGADRFHELIQSQFFDDTAFFRVVKDFVIQFGLNGDPATNSKWKDRTIYDDSLRESNLRGTVTFALSGPNSRTTQIFFNLGDNSRLDSMGGFTPFGRVIEGMDVVDSLYGGYGDMPSQGGKGPDSAKIESLGDAYLRESFPKLDRINKAAIID
jgi:peptidyl-prolyl cis-trans isomerase A (cyclophilin A)